MYSLYLYFLFNFLNLIIAIKNIDKESNKINRIIPKDNSIKLPTIIKYHFDIAANKVHPLSLEYKYIKYTTIRLNIVPKPKFHLF